MFNYCGFNNFRCRINLDLIEDAMKLKDTMMVSLTNRLSRNTTTNSNANANTMMLAADITQPTVEPDPPNPRYL